MTELVKQNSGSLAVVNMREDSRKGAEEIKQEDVSTPILKILHQLSPECNQRDPKYVEGSKPGMIYASSLGQLIDGEGKGIDIIVAHAQTRYPEWQERGDSAQRPEEVLHQKRSKVFRQHLKNLNKAPMANKNTQFGMILCEESEWKWQWAAIESGTCQYLLGVSPLFTSHAAAIEWMDSQI